MRIDHVVLGSRDLDATARRFLQGFGLDSVAGGEHPTWGTANRIVPLGDDYVEFLAVVDRDVAAGTSFGRFLRDLTVEGDRWFTVCLSDDDIDATATRLGLEVMAGSRVRPDGTEVRWRSAGLEDPAREPWLPFFIRWEDQDVHPGGMGATHRVGASGIAWVEMGGDPAVLARWLGETDLPIRHDPGAPPGIAAVGLATSGVDLVLRI